MFIDPFARWCLANMLTSSDKFLANHSINTDDRPGSQPANTTQGWSNVPGCSSLLAFTNRWYSGRLLPSRKHGQRMFIDPFARWCLANMLTSSDKFLANHSINADDRPGSQPANTTQGWSNVPGCSSLLAFTNRWYSGRLLPSRKHGQRMFIDPFARWCLANMLTSSDKFLASHSINTDDRPGSQPANTTQGWSNVPGCSSLLAFTNRWYSGRLLPSRKHGQRMFIDPFARWCLANMLTSSDKFLANHSINTDDRPGSQPANTTQGWSNVPGCSSLLAFTNRWYSGRLLPSRKHGQRMFIDPFARWCLANMLTSSDKFLANHSINADDRPGSQPANTTQGWSNVPGCSSLLAFTNRWYSGRLLPSRKHGQRMFIDPFARWCLANMLTSSDKFLANHSINTDDRPGSQPANTTQGWSNVPGSSLGALHWRPPEQIFWMNSRTTGKWS